MFLEGGLHYRSPIWTLIIETASYPSDIDVSSLELKAEWLKEQIKLCYWYEGYRLLHDRFKNDLSKLLANFSSGKDVSSDVEVLVTSQRISAGTQSFENMKAFVELVIPKVEEFIKPG